MTQVTMIGTSGPARKGRSIHNCAMTAASLGFVSEPGEFECIGQSPPQDHPHVYLKMGLQDEILCPYCGTLFEFDHNLQALAAVPADSVVTY